MDSSPMMITGMDHHNGRSQVTGVKLEKNMKEKESLLLVVSFR